MKKVLAITTFMLPGNPFDARFRRGNLEACRRAMRENFPEARHVVVEQFGDMERGPGANPDISMFDPGPFRKTALLNRAVRDNPGYDIYVMVDADVFVTRPLAEYVLENAGDNRLVFPYGDTVYMDMLDTRKFLSEGTLWPGEKNHGVIIRRQTGLCNAFTRATFDAVGGFDEAFSGWGAEDDAFMFKFRRIGAEIIRNPDRTAVAYHMFHPVINTETYTRGPEYMRNRVYCACIRRMDGEDFSRYLAGTVTLDEMVKKYRAMGRLEVTVEWYVNKSTFLHFDSTIYDIDRSGGLCMDKIFEAIRREDGNEGIVDFTENVLRKVSGMPPDIMADIERWYGEARRCLST